MAERSWAEHRRYVEQSERSLAESMLGKNYCIRVYSKNANVARGTVMLEDGVGYNVHTAYAVCDGEIKDTVRGVAVGVLLSRTGGGFSLVLADNDDSVDQWTQNRIAEAVDYWERSSVFKIYCLREKSCGAVVYTETDEGRKYLIIRMNLGHCGLPKGHIEKYETEEQTAIREVLEETGVTVTLADNFRKSVVYSLTSRTTKESVYFLGRFEGEKVKIQEAEVSSYRLCSYEQARKLITYENDRMILDAAEELLNNK